MRAVPIRCQPAIVSGAWTMVSRAPAAAISSLPRATAWSSVRTLFSLRR